MSTVLQRERRELAVALFQRPASSPEQLFLFDTGLLYISNSAYRQIKRPREAAVLIAISQGPFEIRSRGQSLTTEVAAIGSLVSHSIHSVGVPCASVLVAPDHPHFRVFRHISRPGVLPLPPDAYRRFNAELTAARRGDLAAADAHRLFESIVATTAVYLPRPEPMDPRVARIIAHLRGNEDCRLDDLADLACLSYYRLSHLFSENVGLSLRSYRLWRKLRKAIAFLVDGHKQSDIAAWSGFTDTAHFHRACYETYGFRPSFIVSGRIAFVRQRAYAGLEK